MEVVNENAPSLLQRQLTIRIERQEERLASQLRQFCNNDGKEIDMKRSIPILHSLGKEYQKRSPDKFSLIRSAALYNAALVRSPENAEEIEKDLKELCRLILVEANANKKDRDLIAKAKLVKENVVQLRLKVQEKLSSLNDQETKRIDDIRQLQIEIASDYTEIMAQTAAFCEDVMGEAPFAFAVAGMGSLARREITPYSDFEHIILLSNSARRDDNYKKKLEYYRWFSVIFQVILINLQETILPSLSIISLNGESSRLGNWFYDGYTPRGIAFDGMMLHACKFPLGRQEWSTQKQWKTELIKPVDEMLDYLRSEESLKNGYHLSDILTKTCFVYKDQDVYNVYENGVYQRLEHAADDNSTEEEIKKQVSDDLRNFAIRSAISDNNVKDKFNIKHVIYRSTTLFISAMGRMHNIRASSCFDVVEELARRKKITACARNMLMFAVALACEVRLRWYMINNAQCDEINSDLENETDAISKLCEIVGRESSIKYFHIAYALQCDIARRLKLPKNQFYSNPHLLNLNIGHCFDDLDYLRSSISSSNYTISDERFYNFDECMRALNVSEISQVTGPRHVVSMEEIQKFGISLFRMSLYDDALECFEKVAERFQQADASESDHSCEDWRIAYNYYLIGSCLTYLGRFRRAAQCLEECIEMFEQTPTNSADAKYWIGRCLLQQKKPEQAVRFFVESSRHIMPLEQLNENDRLEPFNESMRLSFQPQEMIRNIDVAEVDPCLESDVQIAYNHYWVGICFIDMRKHQNAIPYLETALEIIEKTFQSKEKDNGIAEILKRLGCCLMNDVKKLKTAINYFNRSLEIKKAVSHNLTFDNEIAEIQHLLGWCLVKQSKFKDAISFFSLVIGDHRAVIARCQLRYEYC